MRQPIQALARIFIVVVPHTQSGLGLLRVCYHHCAHSALVIAIVVAVHVCVAVVIAKVHYGVCDDSEPRRMCCLVLLLHHASGLIVESTVDNAATLAEARCLGVAVLIASLLHFGLAQIELVAFDATGLFDGVSYRCVDVLGGVDHSWQKICVA